MSEEYSTSISHSEHSDSDSDNDFEYDEEVHDLYEHVRSFRDLLYVNIDFLLNKINHTYYYCGPFGDCLDHVPRRDHLVQLHLKYDVYTTEGQSNVCTPTHIQKSYLVFIVQPRLSKRLKPLLFARTDIYTSMSNYEELKYNFPADEDGKYNLTCSRKTTEDDWNYGTNWWNDRFTPELQTRYDHIDEIFEDCSVFFICVRVDREADEILREVLDSMN